MRSVADLLSGPDSRHLFSTLKTASVWVGRYDEHGDRREVDVAGSALPLQTTDEVDRPQEDRPL